MRYAIPIALLIATGCGPSILEVDDGAGEPGTTNGGAETTGDLDTGVDTGVVTTLSTTADPSTSTATLGDDDTGSSDGDGINFIEMPDNPPCGSLGSQQVAHVSFECSPWDQDCCPLEQCVPWANDGGDSFNSNRCSPVADAPAAVGEPCTVMGSAVSGLDDCELGAICWNVDPDTLEGTCVAQCTGDESAPVCPQDLVCSIAGEGSVNVCLPPCNPLLANCPIGEACFGYGEQFVCTSLPESAQYGEPCHWINACDPGLVCVDGETFGCDDPACCTSLCDVTEGDPNPACPDAAAGQTCVPWDEVGDAAPGFEDLGVCVSGG